MSFSGLDRLFLEVNSLEESLVFYQRVLGFEVEKNNSDAEPPMATLAAGSLKLTLAQHLETMLRRGRGVHFFIGVDDVDSFHERVREHNFRALGHIYGPIGFAGTQTNWTHVLRERPSVPAAGSFA